MKVQITGGLGFIGQHLAREFADAGHEVDIVDIREDKPDLRDLRVPGVADAHLWRFQPDVVVHLAARVGRLFGEDNPMETVRDNAGMTALVAQACGKHGVRLVYASTSEVYGDNGDMLCDEDEGPFAMPHNVYGLSKRWGEDVCRLYAPDGFTALRFSMPYGPGLPAGRGRAAIINMLWQARTGQEIPVHKGAERSWCWIKDVVAATRLVVEKTSGGAYNIGRDDEPTSMLDVAKIACELTGADNGLIVMVDAPANQTVVKRLSTQKIMSLGWSPKIDLRTGMENTLDWVDSLNQDGSIDE